jgi:hypothetical protein
LFQPHGVEHPHDVRALGFGERRQSIAQRRGAAGSIAWRKSKSLARIVRPVRTAPARETAAFELADVSRPLVLGKQLERLT